jgi:hypothetical protein
MSKNNNTEFTTKTELNYPIVNENLRSYSQQELNNVKYREKMETNNNEDKDSFYDVNTKQLQFFLKRRRKRKYDSAFSGKRIIFLI